MDLRNVEKKKRNLSLETKKTLETLKGVIIISLFFSAIILIKNISMIIAEFILTVEVNTIALVIEIFILSLTMVYVLPELKKGE